MTGYLPQDFAKAVHGTYQRLRIFIEAFRRSAERLHFFFFVAAGQPADNETARWAREQIDVHWGVDAAVTLCAAMASSQLRSSSFWGHYVVPAVRLGSTPDFGANCGPAQLACLEAALATRPAAVFAHRLSAMLPICMTRCKLPPVFLDLDDVEHRTFWRSIPHLPYQKGKWLLYAQAPALLLGERSAIRRATKTFVCSDADRTYLTSRLLLDRVVTISNSVEIPTLVPNAVSARVVLFLGALKYAPNRIAAEVLVNSIWPRVRQQVGDARLLIAGDGKEALKLHSGSLDGVELLGFVPDLKPLYQRARVFCSPIPFGGGTRIKLIEAAAHGRAIVSTKIGAENLDFADGVHAVLRDDPDQMADACVRLLQDPALAQRLGEQARALVLARYSRAAVVEKIRKECVF